MAGVIELCGVLLGMTAVLLCQPGQARKRGLLLATTVLLSVIGMAFARNYSTGVVIIF
jgi:hypothetical protein